MNRQRGPKKYWFILDNYVHVSVKGSRVMFYNPLSGKILEYTGSAPAPRMVRRLQSPGNLLTIGLNENELLNPGISQLVRDLRENFMGDLVDISLSGGKPVQMAPYLKVHKDAEQIKKTPLLSVGDEMMKYLAEVSLYVNSDCSLDCEMCASAYRQFLCCTRTRGSKKEPDILAVKNLFQELQGASLVRVNVLGGDIFKFSNLEELAAVLNGPAQSFKKEIYSHYLNLLQGEKKLALFPPGSFVFKVLTPFPVEHDRWRQALELLRERGMETHFLFIIDGEAGFNEAEELISLFHLEDYSFHPFFSGRNREFFEDNIFMAKEDLMEAKPPAHEIYARQLVNPLHFGTLTVLSNGHIHANVNEPRLGILNRTGIYDAVYKEMYRGRSWRRIRKKAAPCRRCVFSELCPPLSNYEYALARNNLCHIFPSKSHLKAG